MLKKIIFSLFIVSFISMAFAEEPASPDIKVPQRVEKDKASYNASLEITKGYAPENEIAYWETFLKAEPNHAYAPEIRQRVAELKAKQPVKTEAAPVATVKKNEEKKFKVGKGTIRANVDTGFSYGRTMISDYHNDLITLGASVDYFIIDNLTIGPSLLFYYENSHYTGIDDDTLTIFFGAAIGASAFLSEHFVPYIKVIPGVGIFDFGSTSLKKFALGLEGGLDVMLVNHVALGLAIRYDRMFSDPGINIIGIPIRFAIYF